MRTTTWISYLILTSVCLAFSILSCNNNQVSTAQASLSSGAEAPSAAASEIDGGWYLVKGTYGGQAREESSPFQFKLFREGQFAFLMKSEGGAWDYSSTGSYEIEGDVYREKFEFSTNPSFVGVTTEWKFKISGDSLYMEGPTKIINTEGKEAPELAGGYNTMQEVRVQAK